MVMPASVRSLVSIRARSAPVSQIRRDNLDRSAGLVREPLRMRVEAIAVTGHEDEVKTPARQPVGVDRADA
jgi:hypothetical protein